MNVSGTATPASLYWAGVGGTGTTNWDVTTSANWINGASSSTFYNLDGVTFDDRGNGNVNLTVSVAPSNTVFNIVNTNYIVSGLGQISGSGGLTVKGVGPNSMVTLNTANTFTGDTLVQNASLCGGNYDVGNYVNNMVLYAGGTPGNLVLAGGQFYNIGQINTHEVYQFARVTIKPGGSSITMRTRKSSAAPWFEISDFKREVGGTFDLGSQAYKSGVIAGVYITNTLITNGILGGWATIYQADWLVPTNGNHNTNTSADQPCYQYASYQTTLVCSKSILKDSWRRSMRHGKAATSLSGSNCRQNASRAGLRDRPRTGWLNQETR